MDRLISACAIAAGSLLSSAAVADMVKVADSQLDFSGTQGASGWTYGWYSGSDIASASGFAAANTAAFQTFGYYEAGTGWWTHDLASASSGSAGGSPVFATVITAEQMHASAPIPGSLEVSEEIRWASRRWTSSTAGTVNILGHIAKTDQGSLLGDGADAYILIDGVSVYHYGVEVGDYEGIDYDFSVAVNAGSTIEFVVGARDSALFDAVTFRSEIFAPAVPAPGALALLGAGGLMIGRRRR